MCINFKTMKVGFFFLMTPSPRPRTNRTPNFSIVIGLDIEIKRYKKQRELIIVISLWSYFTNLQLLLIRSIEST